MCIDFFNVLIILKLYLRLVITTLYYALRGGTHTYFGYLKTISTTKYIIHAHMHAFFMIKIDFIIKNIIRGRSRFVVNRR